MVKRNSTNLRNNRWQRISLCSALLLVLNSGYAEEEYPQTVTQDEHTQDQSSVQPPPTDQSPKHLPPPGPGQFGVGYESRFGERHDVPDQTAPDVKPRPWAFWRDRSDPQRPGVAHPARPQRPDRPLRPERPERIERPMLIERPDRPPRPEIIRPPRP